MELEIISAGMQRQEDLTYLGSTVFRVIGHSNEYEITFSKRGKEWDYSLNFANESGDDAELMTVDTRIEEDDEWFDQLLEAAKQNLPQA